MKLNKTILILLLSFSLNACREPSFVVQSDFTYKDETFEINSSLSKVNNIKAHVVLLYGQSNADGAARNEYLESKDYAKFQEYRDGYDNVLINYYNDGGNNSSKYQFTKCTLGCGWSTEMFGPEMGIAEELHYAFKNEQNFIIKWTWGGTTLRDQWLDNHHNRGNLYNSAMDFTLKCLSYMKSCGYIINIDGICWMQGENDSFNNDWRAYYRDTDAFVAQLRHDLSSYQKDIKFIDAAINEDEGMWMYPKAINKAKKDYSETSSLNYFIDTNALGITTRYEPEGNVDYAHYDSLSMVKLGQEYGKIITDNKNIKN